MNNEIIKELNEIREYLGITQEDFAKILVMAFNYKEKNSHLVEEEIIQIIIETMNNMDYQIEEMSNYIPNEKTIQESFERAISNLGYNEFSKNR